MVYKHIENNDPAFTGHYAMISEKIRQKLQDKYENPHVQKVWVEHASAHETGYWVHIKTGTHAKHHEYTIIFTVKNHAAELVDVHEGHIALL